MVSFFIIIIFSFFFRKSSFLIIGFFFFPIAPELVKNQGYFGDEVDW